MEVKVYRGVICFVCIRQDMFSIHRYHKPTAASFPKSSLLRLRIRGQTWPTSRGSASTHGMYLATKSTYGDCHFKQTSRSVIRSRMRSRETRTINTGYDSIHVSHKTRKRWFSRSYPRSSIWSELEASWGFSTYHSGPMRIIHHCSFPVWALWLTDWELTCLDNWMVNHTPIFVCQFIFNSWRRVRWALCLFSKGRSV